MLDIGWSEIALIAVVALVVIGPKELPVVLRSLGRWVRKLRQMAAQLQGQVNDVIREAELTDLHDQMKSTTPAKIARSLDRSIDPDGSIAASFKKSPGDLLRDTPDDPPREDPKV